MAEYRESNAVSRPVRVLVVDDSALIRAVLAKQFTQAGLEVVGLAADPYVARDMVVLKNPDVLTLDLEMPRMDGLTFLEKLMAYHPMPVVVLSSLTPANSETALRALELGAVEVVEKPHREFPGGPEGPSFGQLAQIVRAAARARPRAWVSGRLPAPEPKAESGPRAASRQVVAVGASTGGTEALAQLLEGLPPDHPGLLVVQHMPALFTRAFAERLDRRCALRVKEAQDGDPVSDGLALVAPGDRHMVLKRSGEGYRVECHSGPPVHHVRPSVDVLFHSVAKAAGPNAVGVILTGMGRDGAEGLLAMRRAGAATLAQDEESCIIYGMPKEAFERGAAGRVVPLDEMGRAIGVELRRLAGV